MELGKEHPYKDGRTCSTCGEFKTSEHFYLEKDVRCVGGIAMRSTCKPCTEFRKYKTFIKKFYGITYEQYEELLAQQNFGCAICGSSVSNNKRTSGKLFVDHCHTTGKVRGLLCSRCNHALGQFDDNVELLTKAVSYLNTSKA